MLTPKTFTAAAVVVWPLASIAQQFISNDVAFRGALMFINVVAALLLGIIAWFLKTTAVELVKELAAMRAWREDTGKTMATMVERMNHLPTTQEVQVQVTETRHQLRNEMTGLVNQIREDMKEDCP